MPDFLIRMAADWNPALTSTRAYIDAVVAEASKLDRLNPSTRSLELQRGQQAIAAKFQSVAASGVATPDLGVLTPRDAARLTAQVGAQLGNLQTVNTAAMEEEATARKLEAQMIKERVAADLRTNTVYQESMERVAAAAQLEAIERRRAATLVNEGNPAYITARAETLAAQQRIAQQTRDQAKAINGAGGGGSALGGIVSQIGQGALIGVGFRVAQEIRQAVEEALSLNRQLRVLEDQAHAIGASQDFPALRDNVIDVARQTGVAASEIATLASEFLGLYQNVGQANVATEDAAKLIRVIGGSAQTVGPELGALAEDLNVSVRDIGNAVIDLQDKTGRSGQDMLAALGQVAPVANELNLTLDQTRGLVEAIGVGSAKTGQQIGEGLARVLPELQKNLPKIEQIGIKVSPEAAAGDTSAAVRDLISNYGKLNAAQQKLVTEQLGGPRYAQLFAAAFRDQDRALAQFDSQLTDHDLLNRRAAAAQETFKGAMDKFHQSLVGLGDAFASSGVLDALTALLNVASKLLGAFDGLPAKIAAVAIAMKLLSGINLAGISGNIGGAATGLFGGALARPDGLHYSGGGPATAGGAGAAAGINPIGLVTAATVAFALSVQAAGKKRFDEKRSDLLAELEKETDAQLQAKLTSTDLLDPKAKSKNILDTINPFYKNSTDNTKVREIVKQALAQHAADGLQDTVSALLQANVFGPEDLKRVTDDLANTTDPKKVADLQKRTAAASASAEGQKALLSVAADRARQTAVAAAGSDNTVTTFEESLALYQQGDLGYAELLAKGKAEVDTLAKYVNDEPSRKQMQKDLLGITKVRADHLKQAVQDQIDALNGLGELSYDRLRAIYESAFLSPDINPETSGALYKSLIAAHAQEVKNQTEANNALAVSRAGGDPVGAATAGQSAAQAELDRLTAGGYSTDSSEYKDALAKKNDSDRAVADALNQVTSSKIDLLKTEDAHDPVKVARDNQQAAAEAVAAAHGDAERIRAEAQQVQADQSVTDAINAIANARLELLKATRNAAGDTLGAANVTVEEAKQQIDQARGNGVPEGSAEMLNLQRTLVDALASQDSAVNTIANARLELLKAIRNAAGDTVGAAAITVQEAQQQIDQAKAKGTPADSSDMINLQKTLVEAQAAQVTARIQEIETAADQDLQLHRITIGQAVERYRYAETLATGDEARKAIEIKIQQLLSGASNLQFNLPSLFNLPVLYEARRLEQTGPGSSYSGRSIDQSTNSYVFQITGATLDQVEKVVASGVSKRTYGTVARRY